MNKLLYGVNVAVAGCILAVALYMGSLQAQVVNRPGSFTNSWMLTPVSSVPTVMTDVLVQPGGVYLDVLQLTNTTASPVICTVQDKQATPVVFFPASIAAGQIYVVAALGRWFPGGISWSCPVAGVTGYMSGKY